MTAATPCPKCEGARERGFVVDEGHNASRNLPGWTRGEPRSSWWSGVRSAEKDDPVPMAAFRCRRCGYVEFYADEKYRTR